MSELSERDFERLADEELQRLVEVVEEAEDNGRKVIVFSNYLSVLDEVTAALPGVVFGPLTGAVPAAKRQAMVDDFAFSRAAAGGAARVLAESATDDGGAAMESSEPAEPAAATAGEELQILKKSRSISRGKGPDRDLVLSLTNPHLCTGFRHPSTLRVFYFCRCRPGQHALPPPSASETARPGETVQWPK